MRLIYALFFFHFLILLLLQQSGAENELNTSTFLVNEMEDQIKQLKKKQENLNNVINECKRIFYNLILIDEFNITMDFFDKELDPFGYGIISNMETQISFLRHTTEQCYNQNELDLCKTELNSLKSIYHIMEQLQNSQNGLDAKLNGINNLIKQNGDQMLVDLNVLKKEVNETTSQLVTIKKSQGALLIQVEYVDELRKKQDNLNEDVFNLTNRLKENSFKCDMSTEFNKINDSLEQKYEKVTKLLQNVLPKSCDDIIKSGLGAGVHTLFTAAGQIEVFCDNSGKMLIQKQMEGPIDFNRNWIDYKNGFGNPLGQYWIGLQNLHILTTSQHYEMFYYIKDFDNIVNYSHYDHFIIGSEKEKYKISKIGTFNGNTNFNKFKGHLNMPFSTKDQDNNPSDGENCAVSFKCGWWYNSCGYINLNQIVGKRDYKSEHPTAWQILHWNLQKPLKEASMYIKLHN